MKKQKVIIGIITVVLIIGLIITFVVMMNNKISMNHEHSRIVHMFEISFNRELYMFDKNISFEREEKKYKDTTIITYVGNNEYTINKYGELLACIVIEEKTNEIASINGDSKEIEDLFIEKFKDSLSKNFK